MLRPIFWAAMLGVLLGGCANAVKPSDLPQMRISAVNATTPAGAGAQSDLSAGIAAEGRLWAALYAGALPAGLPENAVTVTVTNVHYKGAVQSLLIGDGHHATASVAVAGPDGMPLRSGTVEYSEKSSYALNGVSGVLIAATSNKVKVDERLAQGLARKAVDFAYGQKETPAFILKLVQDGTAAKMRRAAPPPQPEPPRTEPQAAPDGAPETPPVS